MILLLPSLQGVAGTLIAIVLAAGGIGYQGGQLDRFFKKAPDAPAAQEAAAQNTDGPAQPPSAS